MSEELKPCTCGGQVYVGELKFTGETQWCVGCLNCNRESGKHADKAEAIAAWNRRSPSRQSILEEAAKVKWQPIETAPKGRKVIVAYRISLGKWRQVMACYFEPKTLDSDETEDGFAPEGWYEESDTHEQLLQIDAPPAYWHPLLSPPSGPSPHKEKGDE